MTEVIMNAEVEITDQTSKDVKEGDGNEESMEVDSKDADEEEQLGNKEIGINLFLILQGLLLLLKRLRKNCWVMLHLFQKSLMFLKRNSNLR